MDEKHSFKTKVLITGVAGFIGAHFLEHILENTEWNVVGIASWKHKGVPERVIEVLKGNPTWKDRVEIITHDLSAPFVEQTIKRIGRIDYIVNFAAESHVDRSIDSPVPFVQNNVNVALTMLELARIVKPKKFIQISTDEVYGAAPDNVNFKEWSTIIPSNPYSASKACQEAIAISYWRTYGVPLVITNTMNNFGEMQDKEKYVARVISKLDNDELVQVHGRPGYIGSRYYLHARNHADAVLFILNNLSAVAYEDGKVDRPNRYNVVGDTELSNLEMAELIAKTMGKELKYELVDFHHTRPGHDRRYALDGQLLQSLGWKPPLDIKTSLERTVAWSRKPENKIWL